jgi:hypothetical protein
MVTCWGERTHELVLPDGRVNWSCGGVNSGSSHGSHLEYHQGQDW